MSVSATQGSRLSDSSTSSARPSLSSSPSSRFFAPSPSQSPSGSASVGVSTLGGRGALTTGESFFFVKDLPNFFERMRRRNRVGMGLPALRAKNSCSESGTLMTSIFLVPTSAFANTARAPSRLNTTVFLKRPGTKCLPRMVRRSPTATSRGVTLVTTGALTFFLAALAVVAAPAVAGAASATRAATKAARRSGEGMRARSSIAPGIGRWSRPLESGSGGDGVSTPRR